MESPSEVVAIIGHVQVVLPGRMFGCADNLPLFAYDVSWLMLRRVAGTGSSFRRQSLVSVAVLLLLLAGTLPRC